MKCTQFIRPIVLGLLMTSSISLSVQAQTESEVLSFQAWKNGRVEESKAMLERVQLDTQLDKVPAVERTPGVKPVIETTVSRGRLQNLKKTPRVDQKLDQAELNLEIAQELTISDYFVLYLSQFKRKDQLLEAAKKLTPEETAELMMAYQKQVGTSVSSAEASIPSGLVSPAPRTGL